MHDYGSRFACLAHHRHAHGDFTLPGAEPHYPPDLGIEPIHLDIDLQIDIDARSAAGAVTHTLIWRRAGARKLELDAVALQISAVEDLDGHELRWRHDGSKLRVTWACGAERDATRRLALRYRVDDPAAGKAAGLVLPFCNTAAMNLHLTEISQAVATDAHAVLLIDQAGWHTSDKLELPANISVMLLPPKSPELNPTENTWQFMRDNWLSNRVFKSADDIVDHCREAWNKLVAQPWRIMSIGMRDWAHRF